MQVKFLYLDFDGVLHPNFCDKKQLFCHLPKLTKVLEGCDVNIVISSSWRFQESPDWLIELFPPAIQDSVIGFTGDAHIGRHARWHEIMAHVSTNRVVDWRALDDAVNEFPADCSQLIACNGNVGITDIQQAALLHWLNE